MGSSVSHFALPSPTAFARDSIGKTDGVTSEPELTDDHNILRSLKLGYLVSRSYEEVYTCEKNDILYYLVQKDAYMTFLYFRIALLKRLRNPRTLKRVLDWKLDRLKNLSIPKKDAMLNALYVLVYLCVFLKLTRGYSMHF